MGDAMYAHDEFGHDEYFDGCPACLRLKSDTGFGAWLSRQTPRWGPVGDLAKDYVAPCWCEYCRVHTSKAGTFEAVESELDNHSACDGAWRALQRARKEWLASAAPSCTPA